MTHPFEDIARAELPPLLRYATALCGDPDTARDLVQEVLARALARWDRIGLVERPGAYLMRMVTHEFVSWRRRWSTRSITPVGGQDDLDRRPGRLAAADHGDAITERLDLDRRLSALPRRQQAALVLRFFEGLDYAESAAVLGCAEGTVRSAVSRGLATLRLDAEAGPAARPGDGPARNASLPRSATRTELYR